jgi:hypothetical protein
MAGVGALGTTGAERPVSVLAPLRALDWRFLLPVVPGTRFRRLVLFGGPPGVVARANAMGLASDVLAASLHPGCADAVVAYADAVESIGDIARAVSRDGMLYLEVDRQRAGVRGTTPARVEALLRDAGLTPCGLYALEPNAAGARAFIPLDAPRAMSWHRLTSLGDRAQVRVANAVRQSAVRIGGTTVAALDRPYAVIAVGAGRAAGGPGALSDPEMRGRIGASGEGATSVMLTYGGDRVLFFPFAAEGSAPVAVVKVPKSPSLHDRTENEQARMRALRAALDPALTTAIPEPLGVVRWPTAIAACERFIPGMSLSARAADADRAVADKTSDLRLAFDWLARFHQATETRRAPVRESVAALVEGPLGDHARALGIDDDAALTSWVRSAAATLGDAGVATTIEHHDFAAWNIIRRDSDVAVVDWEGAREGLGAFDAIHLALTWLHSVRSSDGVNDEARCVFDLLTSEPPGDTATTTAREALGDYFHTMELDRRLVPLLIVLHRIELAVRRDVQRRLHGDADQVGGSDDARIVRSLATNAQRLPGARAP